MKKMYVIWQLLKYIYTGHFNFVVVDNHCLLFFFYHNIPHVTVYWINTFISITSPQESDRFLRLPLKRRNSIQKSLKEYNSTTDRVLYWILYIVFHVALYSRIFQLGFPARNQGSKLQISIVPRNTMIKQPGSGAHSTGVCWLETFSRSTLSCIFMVVGWALDRLPIDTTRINMEANSGRENVGHQMACTKAGK